MHRERSSLAGSLAARPLNYWYGHAGPNPSHRYLWPVLQDVINSTNGLHKRAIDIRCGNGATAQMLHERGFDVTGVDLSKSSLAQAREAHPGVSFFYGSVYDDLAATYGQFPIAISLEVIEHLYCPGELCKTLYNVLSDD